jgi:homoserine dehydrogenase
VAGVFADEDVSIQTVRQEGRGDAATLMIVTHSASDAALARTVQRLGEMESIRSASVMRVEGMSADR